MNYPPASPGGWTLTLHRNPLGSLVSSWGLRDQGSRNWDELVEAQQGSGQEQPQHWGCGGRGSPGWPDGEAVRAGGPRGMQVFWHNQRVLSSDTAGQPSVPERDSEAGNCSAGTGRLRGPGRWAPGGLPLPAAGHQPCRMGPSRRAENSCKQTDILLQLQGTKLSAAPGKVGLSARSSDQSLYDGLPIRQAAALRARFSAEETAGRSPWEGCCDSHYRLTWWGARGTVRLSGAFLTRLSGLALNSLYWLNPSRAVTQDWL